MHVPLEIIDPFHQRGVIHFRKGALQFGYPAQLLLAQFFMPDGAGLEGGRIDSPILGGLVLPITSEAKEG
jgi:hypothetical protein